MQIPFNSIVRIYIPFLLKFVWRQLESAFFGALISVDALFCFLEGKMKEKIVDILKKNKIALFIIVAIIAIVAILIGQNSKSNLVGNWKIADIKEWQEYDGNYYNDEFPYRLELFSDGTGISVEKSYSSSNSITWHADNGRLRINGNVFEYKIVFGKLILKYEKNEKSYTMKYKRN